MEGTKDCLESDNCHPNGCGHCESNPEKSEQVKEDWNVEKKKYLGNGRI